MTRDDIIRMAREAGAYYASIDEDTGQEFLALPQHAFKRFAALVAAAEREACARAVDLIALKYQKKHYASDENVADECAAAIRARGQE